MMSRGRTFRGLVLAAAVLLGSTVLTSTPAQAQFVYPGYGLWGVPYAPAFDFAGWGGYGWGLGYPGWGAGWGLGYPGWGYGMTLADMAFMRYSNAALMSGRYNLDNAQTQLAYQAAALYNQQALNTYLSNYKQMQSIAKPQFDAQMATARLGPQRPVHRGAPPEEAREPMPVDRLIARDGTVHWPASAPTQPEELQTLRQEADQAIQQVAQQAQDNGQATIRSVVNAKNRLYAYGQQALEHLRAESPNEAAEFLAFLENLDTAIDTMAGETATMPGHAHLIRGGPRPTLEGAPPLNIRPPGAPRTGGDVLREEIEEQDRESPPRR